MSPMVATTCRIARPSADLRVLRVPGRDRAGGFPPPRGMGPKAARVVPTRAKSQFCGKG
jgi:hypothetical protein